MNDYILLKQVQLEEKHRPTGNTTHYLGNERMQAPKQLRIMRYSDGAEYYLLYLDDNGTELTDTCHESLEAALEQADWEFNVKANEWSDIESE
jgi:hypothetical protein